MKDLYESILGDIDATIAASDNKAELLDLNIPDFYDYKKVSSRNSGGTAALYIWKLPNKVLNKVKPIIYKITSKMTWLSPYEQNPENIIVYCSPSKLYIKLAVDHTIVGTPVLNFSSGYRIPGVNSRNFEECNILAYKLLLGLADINILKDLLIAYEKGYYDQNKMVKRLLDSAEQFQFNEGILDDVDNQLIHNDDVINNFNVFTEIFEPSYVKFNTDYVNEFNKGFDWKLIKEDAKGLKFRTKLLETEYNKELNILERGKFDKEVKVFKNIKDLLLIIDNFKFPKSILDKNPKQNPSVYYTTFNERIKKYIKSGSQNNIYTVYYSDFINLNITKFIKNRGSWEYLLTIRLKYPK